MILSRENRLPEFTFIFITLIASVLTLMLFSVHFSSIYLSLLIFFIIALFLINNKIGFFLLLLVRPLLDIFTGDTLLQIGHLSLNVSSVLAVSAIAVTALAFFKHRADKQTLPFKKSWWLFLVITFLSILYSFNHFSSLAEWIRLLSFYALFLLSFLVIKNRADFLELLAVVAYSAIIPSFFAIFQLLTNTGMTLPLEGISNRIYGTFAHPNPFAYYLVFLILILGYLIIIKNKNLFFNLSVSALYAILLLLTFTRGAWIALVLAIFIVGGLKYRKMLVLFAVLLFLVYLSAEPIRMRVDALYTYNPGSSIEWRKGIWNDGMNIAKEKILLGHGAGTSEEILLAARGPKSGSSDPHNDYLKIFIENGLIGVVAYVILILTLLYNLAKNYRFARDTQQKDLYLFLLAFSTVIFTMSFIDNILRSTVLQWSFWAIMAGTFALNSISKTSHIKK